jgi:DNA mismatch repair protein MutS2
MLAGDRLEVEAGFMKMQVSWTTSWRCCPIRAASRQAAEERDFKPAPELTPVHQEINVIGQRAEEARDNVDQFLDRAVMATASRVRIVHGHGMGILRKVLWELLERHPHVEKHYAAPPQEGGTGATIPPTGSRRGEG